MTDLPTSRTSVLFARHIVVDLVKLVNKEEERRIFSRELDALRTK